MSRQQESLRRREVWLLGQIDLLEQLKGDALHHQLNHLHWVRGVGGGLHHLHWVRVGGGGERLTGCLFD